jgi:predicted LPLAT superfamily acyltransferase
MLEEAGFFVEAVETYSRHRPISALTANVSEENVRRIHEIVAAFTPAQRAIFDLTENDGEVHHNHWFVMVSAIRPRQPQH